MPMEKSAVIETLNRLIQTCKDGENGFRTCADDVTALELKSLLVSAAERCAQSALELQALVQQLGGVPEQGGSLVGSVHRRWVDIKSAITSRDDAAILAECERGESVAKDSYENALARDLPSEVRAIVERQYRGVMKHHDMVRSLERASSAGKP